MSDSVNSLLTYHVRVQPQAWVYKLFQQAAIGKSLCFDWQCKSSDIGQIKVLFFHVGILQNVTPQHIPAPRSPIPDIHSSKLCVENICIINEY